MSKKNEAKKDTNGALALSGGAHDDLADIIGEIDLDEDGLGPIEEGDIKLRLMLFNLKGKTESGVQLRQDAFVDSITEEMQSEIECIWVVRERSNMWSEYDEAEGRNVVMCSSGFGRQHGTMADGTLRPCAGCPDAQWFTDPKGKRSKKCGTVHWLVGIELSTGMPFVVKFRRTSEPAIQNYLNRHHYGRRRTASGQIGNYPLYFFKSKIRLEMHDSGNYALPVIERGDRVPDKETFMELQEQAKMARLWLESSRRKFESESNDEGTGNDASFDFGVNAAGQDVQL